MVKSTAFAGSASTNTFHLHHYDTANTVLYLNGVTHPQEPLTKDCSSTFGATRAHEFLFSSTSIYHEDDAHMIPLELFNKVFYVLGFDLTPHREADEEHIRMPLQRNVRIEVRFKKPLP